LCCARKAPERRKQSSATGIERARKLWATPRL
jgi:hypothetical protein